MCLSLHSEEQSREKKNSGNDVVRQPLRKEPYLKARGCVWPRDDTDFLADKRRECAYFSAAGCSSVVTLTSAEELLGSVSGTRKPLFSVQGDVGQPSLPMMSLPV